MTRRLRTSPPPLPSSTRRSRRSIHDEDLDDDLSTIPDNYNIIKMTFQNATTSLFSDHPGNQWASGHQKIPSRQHFENESQQLN
jgi:hypothetical protein